jgi:flagellin-like protein
MHDVSDEAVSPVIGVILMIAIATVLAGVLFVIVSQIGQSNDQAPTIQFVRDNQNGQLIIVRALRPYDLVDVEARANVDARFGYNAPATIDLPAHVFVPLASTPGSDLVGGDQINFCGMGVLRQTDITIRVTNPKDIVVYQNSFTNLDPC